MPLLRSSVIGVGRFVKNRTQYPFPLVFSESVDGRCAPPVLDGYVIDFPPHFGHCSQLFFLIHPNKCPSYRFAQRPNPKAAQRPRWTQNNTVLQEMKKLIPWIGGLLIGLVLSGIVVLLRSEFLDPAYELVAVSWGTPTSSPDLWLYQIQVVAGDENKDGILEVSAKGCIGASSYCSASDENGKQPRSR